MKTLTVDAYQRVRLPDAKPRTKLAYQIDAGGTIRLIPIKLAASANGDRITNVDPLPKAVLERFYSQPEEDDEEGVQRFIKAQAFGGDD